MMSESVAQGASDTEQTRAMITSLWFISENIAGYMGKCYNHIKYVNKYMQNICRIGSGWPYLRQFGFCREYYCGNCHAVVGLASHFFAVLCPAQKKTTRNTIPAFEFESQGWKCQLPILHSLNK